MISHFRLFLLLGVAALLPAAHAESAKPLTNDDVIAMTKAELPESTIILAIQNSPRGFDVGAPGLIALKMAGVSPKVIEAMLTPAAPPSASSAPATTTPPVGPTEDEAGVLLQRRSTDESQGAMKLVLFKKLNGRSGAEDGTPIYSMDFEAVFSATTDIWWEEMPFRVDFNVKTAKGWYAGYHHASSGSLFRLHGQAQFENTENGWRILRILPTKDFLHEGSSDVRTCVQTVTDNATLAEVNQRQAEVRSIQLGNVVPEATDARKQPTLRASAGPLVLNVEEFRAQLAELPSLPVELRTVQVGGRVACVVPDGLPQNPEWTQETETTARLACTTPGCKSLGGDGDGLVALWEKRTWGSRNTKITHLTEGLLNKPNIQNRRTLGPVSVKVGGQDGLAVLVQGDLNGQAVCYVHAYACSKTHFDHVFMYVGLERFSTVWPKYRLFLASYSLLPEVATRPN